MDDKGSKVQLWIDGSSEYSSMALSLRDELIESWTSEREKGHVEDIPVQTMALLQKAEYGVKDISEITVCKGPGSYTGLRIAYAWIIGLATPQAIPCYEYSRPQVIRNFFENKQAPILIHARRNDYRVWSEDGSGIWMEESLGLEHLDTGAIYLSDEPMDLEDVRVEHFDRSAVHLFNCYRNGVLRDPLSHPVYFNPPYITQSKKALF